jgi:hypothetical protein
MPHTWKAIERMKKLLIKGICFVIWDGTSINAWKDP